MPYTPTPPPPEHETIVELRRLVTGQLLNHLEYRVSGYDEYLTLVDAALDAQLAHYPRGRYEEGTFSNIHLDDTPGEIVAENRSSGVNVRVRVTVTVEVVED